MINYEHVITTPAATTSLTGLVNHKCLCGNEWMDKWTKTVVGWLYGFGNWQDNFMEISQVGLAFSE